MKCLMSLLTVGSLLAGGAISQASDRSYSRVNVRVPSGPAIHVGAPGVMVSLGQAESSPLAAYRDAGPPAPAAESTAPRLEPEPMPSAEMLPATDSMAKGPQPMPAGAPVALFDCVKYRHEHDVHPCAVPMIVSVKDPCACCDPCSCCEPKCVNVQVCAPPCGCPKVTCTRDGQRVKYDYGKYEFTITSRKGVVTVSYDD